MVREPAAPTHFSHSRSHSCKILRDATPKSFVILDGEPHPVRLVRCANFVSELGRGTSTYVCFYLVLLEGTDAHLT